MLDEEDWIEYLNQDDPSIDATLKVFSEGKAFPEPSADKKGKQTAKADIAYSYGDTHKTYTQVAYA